MRTLKILSLTLIVTTVALGFGSDLLGSVHTYDFTTSTHGTGSGSPYGFIDGPVQGYFSIDTSVPKESIGNGVSSYTHDSPGQVFHFEIGGFVFEAPNYNIYIGNGGSFMAVAGTSVLGSDTVDFSLSFTSSTGAVFTDNRLPDTLSLAEFNNSFAALTQSRDVYREYQIISLRENQSETVPEPTTLIIWSLLGAFGFACGYWRKRKAV